MKPRKRLGDLLIETGLLTTEQLDKALGIQKKTGERLGRVLINVGYITEEKMIEVLEFQLGIPHLDLSAATVDREMAAIIPLSMAERYQVIPVKKEGKKLTLAMADPTNIFAIDDIRMASGCEIEPVIAAEKEIKRLINQSYGVQEMVEKAVSKIAKDEIKEAELETVADDAPVVSIVNSLISQAIKDKASDIHIEPLEARVRVRYRIDGVLREIIDFPKSTQPAIVSRIKIMSEMDIAEKRIPQDGRIKVTETDREVDLRVSTLPTILGEKVVMRILDKKSILLSIKSLGLTEENMVRYTRLYQQSYGMILVTGPTGSGKTTTLYSTLTEVNSPGKNIITVEDPVEYRLDGINQVQVNPKAGLSFAEGLRSILRQDPNIVMVGEIRDGETADIAIRAALTGHLVLSTLHTNDAAGAISRLADMGVEPFLVASSVLGVVAQRLVRLICPNCKTVYNPPPDSPIRDFLEIGSDDEIALYKGDGCPQCNQTGYRGRLPIHEVLPITREIREAINRRCSSDEIAVIAKTQGMKSMRDDGVAKALDGLTSIEEVMRVAYSTV